MYDLTIEYLKTSYNNAKDNKDFLELSNIELAGYYLTTYGNNPFKFLIWDVKCLRVPFTKMLPVKVILASILE